MNVKLLRKVVAEFRREPRKLDMNRFAQTVPVREDLPENPPCGVVGCISGHGLMLQARTDEERRKLIVRMRKWDFDGWLEGARVFGLTEEQAERLFAPPGVAMEMYRGRVYYSSDEYTKKLSLCWPLPLARRYERCKTQRGKVRVLTERVELFIRTRGEK